MTIHDLPAAWIQILDQVREQQAFMDMFTKAWIADYREGGRPIHCRKGCSGCCNLTVNATFAEALLVAREVTDSQADAARAHVNLLRKWAERSASLKDYLRLHRSQEGFCPFLDPHGSCTIYPIRPFSCRSLLSTMDERWCSADFAVIPLEEKERFSADLDRNVVAFPLHYVASIQELGRDMESGSRRRMADAFGFSLYGSFPALVVLALDGNGAAACLEGSAAARRVAKSSGLDHPFLVCMDD